MIVEGFRTIGRPMLFNLRFLDEPFDALFRYFGVSTEVGKVGLVVLLGAVLGLGVALGVLFSWHVWVIDSRGHPIVTDFVAWWAAGHEALKGAAGAAYDPRLQHVAEEAGVGHRFDATLPWPYPPVFLFVAAILALLPYAVAFLAWSVLTLTLYAAVVARIAKTRIAFLLAPIAPWVFVCIWVGQNGLFTAALIGLALLHLERRPLLSGLMLGLLSYKPQFGVLFPLALAAGGYWRAFAAAALATLALNGLGASIFGFGTIQGFWSELLSGAAAHANGSVDWIKKLQSLYGLTRALGGSPTGAAWVQIVTTSALAGMTFLIWRSAVPYSLKAAMLAAATLLATPYVFGYDLPSLGVAIAFLQRDRGLDNLELRVVVASAVLAGLFVFVLFPTGEAASFAILSILGLRLRTYRTQNEATQIL